MATYQVSAPDGSTYEVSGDPQKVQDTINSITSPAQSNAPTQPQGGEGSVMSFIRAAGNQMPLGQQFSALMGPGTYSQNMQAGNDATAQDKANNPKASLGGSIAGAVAPALVPGVGEMMAANPVTAGAVLGGTGAIANTDVAKNPLQAVNQAGTGAATGALLSGLLAKILPTQQSMEAKANTLANKSVNMPSGVLGDMTEAERQAQGSALRDAGVIVKDKQEALTKAKGLLQNYGQKIGEVADTTQGQGLTADADQHYSAITNLINKAQDFAGSENKVSKAIGRDYRAGAADIANLGDNPSWDAIQSLKEKYGSFAFKDTATQGAKDTYFALSNMLKGIADKAQTDPTLGDQYKEALAGYSTMSPVVDGLKDAVDNELRGGGAGMGARGMIGLIRKMPGEARAAVGAAALAMGHPTIAGIAAIPELTNPALQSQAAGAASKVIGAIPSGGIPIAGSQIADLINQLKQKYDQRSKM